MALVARLDLLKALGDRQALLRLGDAPIRSTVFLLHNFRRPLVYTVPDKKLDQGRSILDDAVAAVSPLLAPPRLVKRLFAIRHSLHAAFAAAL